MRQGIYVFTFLMMFVIGSVAGADSSVKDAAGGDVCDIRPDLCGGTEKPKAKSKRKLVKRVKKKKCRAEEDDSEAHADLPICGSEAAELAGEMEDELFSTKAKRSTASDDEKSLERELDGGNAGANNGPMGTSPGVANGGGPKSMLDGWNKGTGGGTSKSGAATDNATASPVNFDSYMQSNAGHPALSSTAPKRQQNAFEPVARSTASTDTNPSAGSTAGTGAAGQPNTPASGVLSGAPVKDITTPSSVNPDGTSGTK